MVGTLIRHEYLRTRAPLAAMFGLATILTLVGTLMAYAPWAVIATLGIILSVAAVGGLIVAVQLWLAFDYWRSSYSKTGYFTQSLPIKGATIYGAKLLWGSIVTVVTLIWSLLLAVAMLLGASHLFNWTMSFLLDELRTVLGAAPAWAWVFLAIVFVAMFLGGLAQYYFAASIGSEARLNGLGVGGPILIWFGLYLVMQVLLFLGIVAIPLGLTATPDGSSLVIEPMNFLTLMLNNQEAIGMPLGFLPVMFLVSAVLIWRTVVSWNKKVSLA